MNDNIVMKVREHISSIRILLDDMMYGGSPLSDAEYKKCRKAYDLVCKANDTL